MTAPKIMLPAEPVALVLSVVLSPKVTGPNTMAVFVVLMVPLRVLIVGLVAPAAFKPPVYVWVPNVDPKAKVPVLRKVTALVIVVPVALRPKL